MYPDPNTASTPCATLLTHQLAHAKSTIEPWLDEHFNLFKTLPFYASVDLRNSGVKIAPVDTNLFPAGFNNLPPEAQAQCSQAAHKNLSQWQQDARKLLVIPENHTRNQFYFQSLKKLYDLLTQSGWTVRIGSLREDILHPTTIALTDQQTLTLEPICYREGRIQLEDFDPEVILLNNDLSDGIPQILRQPTQQAILPPPQAGWNTRRKSRHFFIYEQLVKQFAQNIGLDPWMLAPFFDQCTEVNFHTKAGEKCIKEKAQNLLDRVKTKYQQYDIDAQPYIVVKANAGTYGMGVLIVKQVEDLDQLNRKQRQKMTTIKGGQPLEEVILQEGVYTHEKRQQSTAEPVIYLIDRHVVGGFYRIHPKKGPADNLNTPGMHFEAHHCQQTASTAQAESIYAYSVIARLALLAASYEVYPQNHSALVL